MNVQRTAVIETQQLMLRALFYRCDTTPAKRGDCAARDQSLEGGMKEAHARDDLSSNSATDSPSSAFDFGELRHRAMQREIANDD